MPETKVTFQSPAANETVAALHDRLVEAGQTLGENEITSFAFSINAPGGSLLAGCSGEVRFRSAHVVQLWVAEQHRGEGLGRVLMSEAEAFARSKHCERVLLETLSDRARDLYRRLGYRVYAEVPRYAGDRSLYFIEKRL